MPDSAWHFLFSLFRRLFFAKAEQDYRLATDCGFCLFSFFSRWEGRILLCIARSALCGSLIFSFFFGIPRLPSYPTFYAWRIHAARPADCVVVFEFHFSGCTRRGMFKWNFIDSQPKSIKTQNDIKS
jgi:hypothetical protein